MRLLFIHDGPIYYDGKGNYYEYSYHGLYERYGFMADEITFLMRVCPACDSSGGTLLNSCIKVIPIPNFLSVKSFIKCRKHVKRIIKKALENADIVILRGSFTASLAFKSVVKKKIPYIYECVGCVWDSLWNHGLFSRFLAPFAFFKTRGEIANSEYVYYVTSRFLQKRYPTKGISVGCSNVVIDKVDYDVIETRKKRNASLGKDRKIVIGTAAALDVLYKGQEYVIKAMPRWIDMGYDVEYRLAGGNRTGSNYLSEIAKKNGVSDRVFFCGSLSSSDMIAFYDGIDVYVQPSKQEGLPRSLVEAMSRGCLCIGSNIAGIPELLPEEFLFEKGKVFDLVVTFRDLLESNFDSVSQRNIRIASNYSIDVLNNKREEFYKMFIKGIDCDKIKRGNDKW